MTSSVTDKRFVDLVVPVLLTALLAVLGWIGASLQSMNQALAVAVYRIEALEKTERHQERRIETLETQRSKDDMK